MSATHTPGPWTSRVDRYPNGEFSGRPYIYAPNAIEDPHEGRHVAELCTLPEVDSNARLIASAPDLLAACEAALEVAKISFNPHPEDEASTITLGRGTLQHLANHLAGAIAKARGA